MPRYWAIAPVESKPSELFDAVWQFDLANSCITIGWSELGDVSQYSKEQLLQALGAMYAGSKPATTLSLYTNMIWNFFHEIQIGDVILARRGRKILEAVGTVRSLGYFSNVVKPELPKGHSHRFFLGVTWSDEPRKKRYLGVVFPMHTLAQIMPEQHLELVGAQQLAVPNQLSEPDVVDQTEFVLEKYLEEFIISNFKQIFKNKLEVYEDDEGNDGQQYTTDIGPIDILATEASSKTFVVIELKKGRTSDQVVGQILRYMGWVKANLCTGGQSVKGLVICRSEDPKLTYALSMTNNISVRYYSVDFKLTEAK